MLRKQDQNMTPVRLPDVILEQLTNAKLPTRAIAVMRSEGAALTLTTRGLADIAARLHAQRRVIEESLMLEQAEGQLADVAELRATIKQRDTEIAQLHAEVEKMRNKYIAKVAEPAMAQHAHGAQR
jgi:alkyl hydroperoxide reductase subunit AhpF